MIKLKSCKFQMCLITWYWSCSIKTSGLCLGHKILVFGVFSVNFAKIFGFNRYLFISLGTVNMKFSVLKKLHNFRTYRLQQYYFESKFQPKLIPTK